MGRRPTGARDGRRYWDRSCSHLVTKQRDTSHRCYLLTYLLTRPPSSTPTQNWGTVPPHAKIFLRLTRKWREIAFRFQQTNFTQYGGLSHGATPDPLLQIGGCIDANPSVF